MSDIRANTISDVAGTGPIELTKQSAAKAWAKVSGAAALTGGMNISSVTDNSTGFFTFSFANSFSSQDYSATAASMTSGSRETHCSGNTTSEVSTRSVKVVEGTPVDVSNSLQIHGDLA